MTPPVEYPRSCTLRRPDNDYPRPDRGPSGTMTSNTRNHGDPGGPLAYMAGNGIAAIS